MASPCFVAPALPFRSHCSHRVQTSRRRPHPQSCPPSMVSVSRPQGSLSGGSDDAFTRVAKAAAEFMSLECQDHLANYVVRFGEKIKDLEIINDINVSGIEQDGINIDVITCDHDGCVCLREKVSWLEEAVVDKAEDIPQGLKHLSKACGLDETVF